MSEKEITGKEHIQRHRELHRELNELVADFIRWTKRLPSKTTLLEFMQWSYYQTLKPDEPEEAKLKNPKQ